MKPGNVECVAVGEAESVLRGVESTVPGAVTARISVDLSSAGQLLLAMLPPPEKKRSTGLLEVSIRIPFGSTAAET
jgi:hypothetical protein